eukprot:1160170-Pelagomonas_calceolata.AAC.5
MMLKRHGGAGGGGGGSQNHRRRESQLCVYERLEAFSNATWSVTWCLNTTVVLLVKVEARPAWRCSETSTAKTHELWQTYSASGGR